jgi:hypothetical protein
MNMFEAWSIHCQNVDRPRSEMDGFKAGWHAAMKQACEMFESRWPAVSIEINDIARHARTYDKP